MLRRLMWLCEDVFELCALAAFLGTLLFWAGLWSGRF